MRRRDVLVALAAVEVAAEAAQQVVVLDKHRPGVEPRANRLLVEHQRLTQRLELRVDVAKTARQLVERHRASHQLGLALQPILVMGIDSDVLYPLAQQEEIHALVRGSEFSVIRSDHGHDGFLLEVDQVATATTDFLARVRDNHRHVDDVETPVRSNVASCK